MTSAHRSQLDDGAVSPPSVDLAALHRVTVVVVTHHSAHCVPALATHLAAFPHVVVVDNASDDKTPALVRKALPQAQVLKLKRNLGYGAANNRALDRVSTPYALLLNPDAESCEFAVAVADRWQGCGVGGALMRAIRRRWHRRFTARSPSST